MTFGLEYIGLRSGDYKRLYRRFSDGFADMWGKVGDVKGKRVLDLCCGTGEASLAALSQGATMVEAMDASGDMAEELRAAICDMKGKGDQMARLRVAELPIGLTGFDSRSFDVVWCRQGVNYWMLDQDAVSEVFRVVAKDGLFVFNTFGLFPPMVPSCSAYAIDGVQFSEASWSDGGRMVFHVQMREGMAPHVSQFPFVYRHEWERMLDKAGFRFEVSSPNNGKTLVFKCVKG